MFQALEGQAIQVLDSAITSLQHDLARYEPQPTRARMCLFPQSKLDKETRDKLALDVRKVIQDVVGIEHFPQSPYELNIQLSAQLQVDGLSLTRRPLQLAGYYLKRSRTLSQTPMFVEGGKRRVGTNSVFELICGGIKHHFYRTLEEAQGKEINFASAGREDVDAQVFGQGRLMLLTIPDPTRNADDPSEAFFQSLEEQVAQTSNDLVRVSRLRVATEDDKQFVLEGAELRRKLYVCVIELERPSDISLDVIDNLVALTIKQRTPIRVAHRRAMMERERIVHRTTLAPISPTVFVYWIDAGAGFYIKEFIHGDLGRTSPSVSEMLNVKARLVTLDFLGCVQDDSSIENIQAKDFW